MKSETLDFLLEKQVVLVWFLHHWVSTLPNWNDLGITFAASLLHEMRCKPGSKLKDAPLFLDHMQLIQKVRNDLDDRWCQFWGIFLGEFRWHLAGLAPRVRSKNRGWKPCWIFGIQDDAIFCSGICWRLAEIGNVRVLEILPKTLFLNQKKWNRMKKMAFSEVISHFFGWCWKLWFFPGGGRSKAGDFLALPFLSRLSSILG